VNSARIGVLVLAVIAAALAAFLVRGLVSSKNDQPQQIVVDTTESEVLVAASPMEVGQKVNSTDLRWQSWPESAVNPVFITRQRAPGAIEQFTNTVARAPIAAGEPVTAEKLIDPNNAGFMSALIRPGMRAVALSIAPETGAGGFILPNDHVDIIATMEVDSQMRSTTLMRNIRVLAIDQTFRDAGAQVALGRTATVEVTPSQAESLLLAVSEGTLSLALRSLAAGDAKDEDMNAEGSTVKVIRFGVENFVRVK